MSGFLDITVRPLYGQFRALITWKVEPSMESATFQILKSHDGVNDWKEIGTVVAGDHFVDDNLLNQGKLLEQYYRLIGTKLERRMESVPVGTFGTVSRQEFGAARQIMELEYMALRKFTKVHLFKLRVFAPPCPLCVDKDTEQAVGTGLCPQCYGTQKDKGYEEPVVTYMRIMNISPIVKMDSADGTGATDPSLQTARLLAFPLLRKEDLLIHKEADRRYLVNEVDVSYLGGKIPVIAMAKLTLLTSTDIRYKIPV